MIRTRSLIPLAILASTVYGADFTTYIGDENQYQVSAIMTDSAANTYVTGSRVIQSATDVFVTKLDATGKIVFTTTFGGKGSDLGNAIALDAAGNIWIGGTTSSENFPLHAALQTSQGAGDTGFLVELASDGTVIYSSYFGGLLGRSAVNGVATDASGNVYVTGSSDSSDFPTTPGLPAGKVTANEITPVTGVFITKLDPTGVKVIYSALIVGNSVDCSGGSSCFLMARNTSGVGIAVDAAGDAFVAGNTNTTDLPITSPGTAGYGAFAAEINAAGNQLVYLTYLGPPAGIVSLGPPETISATAVTADAAGYAYLTGYTNDPEFPATPGAYQSKLNADLTQSFLPSDAFAIKLSAAGTAIWGTYLGGPGSDSANSISLDNTGNVWLVGKNAAGFPSASPGSLAAAGDFLAELKADGSALLYTSEFVGGAASQGVAVDESGAVHLAGASGLISVIAPKQPPGSRIVGIVNAAAGQLSGRISPAEIISIFGYGLGPAMGTTAAPGSGDSFPTLLDGIQVLVNGTAIPLLYVSASQINAEIPAPLNGPSAVVQVINGMAMLSDFHVSVDASIFALFLNPDGSAVAINQDGSVNSASHPAQAGTIVTIWGTGFGDGYASGPISGAIAPGANNWCSSCQISLNGGSETVAYGGAAPDLIDGLMQVNFMVPPAEYPGQLSLDFLGGTGFIWVSH